MKKSSIGKVFIVFFVLMFLLYNYNEDLYSALKTGIFKTNTLSHDSTGLKVYFLDVGQADSILIESDEKYMLIDAGNNEDGEKLVHYFQDTIGVDSFQYVVGTHAHEDHIGGMDNIINQFSIGTFYMPDVVTTTKTFEEVLDSLEAKNLAFDTPKIGDKFSLGSATIEVLYVGTDENDLNNSSIVLRLTYGDVSILFTGDATSEIENEILSKNIASDVLKVGHHGSKYSSTASFLKKVHPTYSIISVGKDNSYSHPHQTILDKLEKLGSKIYRTDESGTVVLTSDGKKIEFETIQTDTNG